MTTDSGDTGYVSFDYPEMLPYCVCRATVSRFEARPPTTLSRRTGIDMMLDDLCKLKLKNDRSSWLDLQLCSDEESLTIALAFGHRDNATVFWASVIFVIDNPTTYSHVMGIRYVVCR